MKMPSFNCNRRRHFYRVIGFRQLQHSQSLSCIYVCIHIPNVNPTFIFLKSSNCNPTSQTSVHKSKWENTGPMDGNYVVESLPFHIHNLLLLSTLSTIINKEDNPYRIIISNIPQCNCMVFTNVSSYLFLKQGNKCIANTFVHVCRLLCMLE